MRILNLWFSVIGRTDRPRISRGMYSTHKEVRVDIFDYIEASQNRTRRHTKLGSMARQLDVAVEDALEVPELTDS